VDGTATQRMGGVVGLTIVPEHLKEPAVAVSKQKPEAHNGCGVNASRATLYYLPCLLLRSWHYHIQHY
jgi:hypothetical protein